MAKSPVGGSRAYITGRIGSDVYSLGKDGKGKRQQVVRALAEEVANPRSQSQMINRMIMSTVMQAVHAMSAIIDHSFDGVPKGQPSISEFIRRNYALVKADALAHPAGGNKFGLNMYQEKGVKLGAWVISAGRVAKPAAVSFPDTSLDIALTAGTLTVGGLKAALGLSADGYITGVGISSTTGFKFVRAQLTTTLADSTAITAENVGSLFTLESNAAPTVSLSTNTIQIALFGGSETVCGGVIVSEKINGAWAHSACTLPAPDSPTYKSDVALPTYPVGEEQFLNGGDI